MDTSHLKKLKARVECLREELHRRVDSDQKKLSDPSILPLSKELDALIIDYMRAKRDQK